MNRLFYTLCALIVVVFSTAFAAVDHPTIPLDDLGERRSVDSTLLRRRHVEAVKRFSVYRDSLGAEQIWRAIVEEDEGYAPALYYLSKLRSVSADDQLKFARDAYKADKQNKWYVENYAMMLVHRRHLDEALPVFYELMSLDNKQPAVYYYIAYIYALSNEVDRSVEVLDSAAMRIGLIPSLEGIKQQMLITSKKYDQAIEVGRRLVEEHPYDIDAHMSLGESYELAGNDSLALASYESAYRLDTTRAETIVELLDFHIKRGNNHERFKYESKVFALSDIELDVKRERLDSFMSDADFYRLNYFGIGLLIQTLIEHYPAEREFLVMYADHLYYGGMTDEAVAYFRPHLMDEDVTASDYCYAIAMDAQVENYELLEQDIKRGLELFSDNRLLWEFYFLKVLYDGDIDGAISVMQQAFKSVKTDKDRSFVLGRIGDCYYLREDMATCYKYYRQALKYDPDNVDVLNNYAYYLSEEGKSLDKALDMSKRAITLEPNEANYVDTHAWVLHCLGRDQEAKIYMRQALSLQKRGDATYFAHYGDILWALGEKFMAETYWQKAVEHGYDEAQMQAHITELKLQSNDR